MHVKAPEEFADQCGSTDARSLGFVTEALAWVIHRLSGGIGNHMPTDYEKYGLTAKN